MKKECRQCPRDCGADREHTVGYCGVPWSFRVARVALHHWEEPSISGTRGSGTVFFSGCNLRCVFCQNREVSRASIGREVSEDELIELMLRLEQEGAHNINLVTPTPYAEQLAVLLPRAKERLSIPIVYNSGGYERVETLRALEGLVDVYLPDVKYFDPALAARYSGANDYFAVACDALEEMLRQTGSPVFDRDGLLLRGTVVRHLVLPTHRDDSIALLGALKERFGSDAFLLSLMSQYTPDFARDCPYPNLHRRVTSFEYDAVCQAADALGFDGYVQSRESSRASYTPDFHEVTF